MLSKYMQNKYNRCQNNKIKGVNKMLEVKNVDTTGQNIGYNSELHGEILEIKAVFDTNYHADKGLFVVCEPNKARYKTIITNVGIFSINKECEYLTDLI